MIEMSLDSSTRLMVVRSLTWKTGDGYEKVMLQAEAPLPGGLTLEEAFRDLHGTVLKALQEASTISEKRNRGDQLSEAGHEYLGEPAEKLLATDGEELGQLYRFDNAFTVRVSEKLKLEWDAAPVQSFLIPRVLDLMWNRKQIDSYDVQRSPDGFLTGIRIEFGDRDLKVERVKDLLKAITWTLRRLYEEGVPLEHRHTGTPLQSNPTLEGGEGVELGS